MLAHPGMVSQEPLAHLVLLGHQYQVQVGSLVLKGGGDSMAGLVKLDKKGTPGQMGHQVMDQMDYLELKGHQAK